MTGEHSVSGNHSLRKHPNENRHHTVGTVAAQETDFEKRRNKNVVL